MTRKTVAGFTRYGTKTAVFFKKYAFLLHVLNKNKNQILSMICPGLSENRKKLIPTGKKTPLSKNNIPQKFCVTRRCIIKKNTYSIITLVLKAEIKLY